MTQVLKAKDHNQKDKHAVLKYTLLEVSISHSNADSKIAHYIFSVYSKYKASYNVKKMTKAFFSA